MRFLFFILLLPLCLFSQEANRDEVELDSLFREDQFYFSVAYNAIQNKPSGYGQYSFSPVFSVGFLRDMPLTKNRKLAVALGAGYRYANTKHSLSLDENQTIEILQGFNKNTLNTHAIEFPFELRWRNALPNDHKFFRTHLGFKVSYQFYNTATTETDTYSINVKNTKSTDRVQYAPYFCIGYNTFNLYASYSLNSVYKDQFIGSEPIEVNELQIGLMFYIL